MKLYQTATGKWAGTQADARADGKGWSQIEVPTDKAGLIAFLNSRQPDPAASLVGHPDEPEPVAQGLSSECPKCKWNLKARLAYSAAAEQRATVEGLCDFIEKAPAPVLDRLTGAVIGRLDDLRSSL